jgi:surface protein
MSVGWGFTKETIELLEKLHDSSKIDEKMRKFLELVLSNISYIDESNNYPLVSIDDLNDEFGMHTRGHIVIGERHIMDLLYGTDHDKLEVIDTASHEGTHEKQHKSYLGHPDSYLRYIQLKIDIAVRTDKLDIKAIYETKIPGIYMKLFDKIDPIDKVIIDGNTYYYIDKYPFEETGEHIVFIKFDMVSSTSVDGFFSGNKYLKSVTFSNLDDELNNKKIPNVNFVSLFKNCENLISVDFSRIAYNYSAYLNNMFEGCRSLRELNLDGFDTRKVYDMRGMFGGCRSLQELDIRSFVNKCETNGPFGDMTRGMFEGVNDSIIRR